MKLYEFLEEGWFMGTYYKVGDRIRLYPKQIEQYAHKFAEVEG